MADALTETPVTVNATVERAPKCTRELFLRPPDWRYQEASAYLRELRQKKSPGIPTDPFVQYAIRLLRAEQDKDAYVYTSTLWPEVTSVMMLGTVFRHSAIAAEIEANIIHGTTPEQLVADGFYVPPAVYALYEKIFFDLSGITTIQAWINDFLFEPERHSHNQILLRTRLLAYHGDPEKAMEAAVVGAPMSSDTKELMKTIATSERQKKVFDYLVKETRVDADVYVGMMETAVKNMTERDFQERMRARDEVGSSSLEELAHNLEQGIRAFSQQEMSQADSNGLDFNNQFVAGILQKDNDNGK